MKSTLSPLEDANTKAQHNPLSFQTWREKLQPHSFHSIKPPLTPNTSECISKKNKYTIKTITRRIAASTKNMSDATDYFTLKRVGSNNSSLHDLSSPKTTPSTATNNSTAAIPAVYNNYDDEEGADEEEELILSLEEESSTFATGCTKSTSFVTRAVPHTDSFINELSKRLAQSEKKGGPVSQTSLSMRRSVPDLEQHSHPNHPHQPILTIPPISALPAACSMHHLVHHDRKSVPSSTSSPSLMKRSTTETSLHSINSSCNSSVLSSPRNNWHFNPWFSHLPPLSSTQEDSRQGSPPQDIRVKRARVLQELIATEKSYQADMELVQEIYYDTAVVSDYFSKLEIKQVFINLQEIIDFEKDFVYMLDQVGLEEHVVTIGAVFSAMIHRMEHIYGDYCKRHKDAVCKLQEVSLRPVVQSFLSICKEKMQGRTTCWDLPSLLIKPVQRVLKYPLLLKEIFVLTPNNHSDYEQLAVVTTEIQQVADHINEIKRRKDMVEQMISDKKKGDRHMVQGINKKFIRKVHGKRKSSATHDTQFDYLYKQFVMKQEMVQQFELVVQHWVIQIKKNNQCLSDLVESLDAVYGESDGIGLRSISAFKKLASRLLAYPMEDLVKDSVFKRIESYLKLFKNPAQIIQKRNRKFIDYDRACYLVSKGELLDKQLQMSAEAYISLNAHLLDELPPFLTLAGTYFGIIVDEFARIQAQYWHQQSLEWKSLVIEQPFGKMLLWDSLKTDYQNCVERLRPRINNITTKIKHDQQLEDKETFVLEKISSIGSLLDDDDDQLSRQLGASSICPLLSLRSKDSTSSDKKKYDSLFSESEPVFECVALVDYESPEKLKVHEGDLIQVWLSSATNDGDTGNGSSSSDGAANESATDTIEWWYGSLANKEEDGNNLPVYVEYK